MDGDGLGFSAWTEVTIYGAIVTVNNRTKSEVTMTFLSLFIRYKIINYYILLIFWPILQGLCDVYVTNSIRSCKICNSLCNFDDFEM